MEQELGNVGVRVEQKLGIKKVGGYAFGEIGGQFSWYMINSYLMIFYTDIVGLTAGAISLIMLIARIWDAINDPMMGIICDRTNTRWGKFRPYIMYAPPFLAIFNVLTFTVFPLEGTVKMIVCLLCYIGVGMLFTATSTAYASLVNVVTKDSHARAVLGASRNFGNALSATILSAIAMPLILLLGNGERATAKGYFFTAIVFSLISIPCYWITAAICKEEFGSELHANDINEKKSIKESLKAIIKNDQLLIVLANTLGGTIGIMGRMSMLSYYIIYVVGSYQMIAPVYTIMNVGSILGSFFIPAGTKKFGKKNYMLLLNILMILGFILMFVFPTNNIVVLLAISFVIGISNSSYGVVFGMISDCIEYGYNKTGKREEGLTTSFLTLSVKMSTAICGSAGVLLLAATGYVPNANQTQVTCQGINVIVNLVPAICVFLSIIPLFFYKLTNEKVDQIKKENESRN